MKAESIRIHIRRKYLPEIMKKASKENENENTKNEE